MATSPMLESLKARTDLEIYGTNAILLFALELKFDIEDIHAIAASYLTDGNDDKKCDLVYVDRGRRCAVVAQGYYSENSDKKEAKASKASDLNTAAAWLLSMDINSLPAIIKSPAQELRSALDAGEIEFLEFWYVHNLPESPNVARELASVERTAQNAIKNHYPNAKCKDDIRALEVGINVLNTWYKSITTPILVEDSYTVSIPGGYKLQTGDWEAYATAVPAAWLYDLFREHKEALFSANPRGYLGSRRSDRNINNGIKESAVGQPHDFWAYNNGITALVNALRVIDRSNKKLRVSGISIVNGAQTTGAIGTLQERPDPSVMVPARFIKCSKQAIVKDIVEYNNSQNQMEPADFRSKDRVQTRLRQEFEKYPANILYSGGKRGGTEDRIFHNPNMISSDTVAQALTAFHGKPREAYNTKSELWKQERLYNNVFNEYTTAEHIIFVYSLHTVLTNLKLQLMEKSREEQNFTSDEKELLSFLRLRGAIYLFITAMGSCIETLLSKPVPNKFQLKFLGTPSLADCQTFWENPVQVGLSFNKSLKSPLENSLRSNEEISKAVAEFSNFIRAIRIPNNQIYDAFSSRVVTTGHSSQ